MSEAFLGGKVVLHGGDNRDVLKGFADCSIDSIVTDPPYALVSITKRFGKEGAAPVVVPEGGSGAYARASRGFMGKTWDTGETAFAVEFWAEIYRVLKPGGHVVSFSGTRTYHRMAVAIEDAGFEIRDCLSWIYGSGFPKSHDVSKGIDRAASAKREVVATIKKTPSAGGENTNEGWQRPWAEGKSTMDITAPATDAARQWQGFGTALKPALEPICLARKPLIGTVVENVLAYGTGAINIDGCRVGTDGGTQKGSKPTGVGNGIYGAGIHGACEILEINKGRWPANILHDGSEEVVSGFPETGAANSGARGGTNANPMDWGNSRSDGNLVKGHDDNGGSASRYFYTAKADAVDRAGSKHPTVKPVDLMQWLCRLITPPGGTVLDPFAGSGTTGEAAWREGFDCILIEREAEYQDDIRRRLKMADQGPVAREHSRLVALGKVESADTTPLFGGMA